MCVLCLIQGPRKFREKERQGVRSSCWPGTEQMHCSLSPGRNSMTVCQRLELKKFLSRNQDCQIKSLRTGQEAGRK